MKTDQFEIWITVANPNPDIQDIARAQCELENLGIKYEGKVGIGFTLEQWVNFVSNISRFEHGFTSVIPAFILGFPVRLIEEIKR